MSRQRRQRARKSERRDIVPLSNYDLLILAASLGIPHFHGVFMRDTLTKKRKPAVRECWILNHGTSRSNGTHWTALAKQCNTAFYFDSFGKLPPPLEVLNYLGSSINLYYNVNRYQNYGSSICGHLCLKFLCDFWFRRKRGSIKTRSSL